MKNDIYALLYKKGTETGKSYTAAVDRKRKTLTMLALLLGLPLLAFIGYQYIPPRLSLEVTPEDMADMSKEADEKKLGAFFSNTALYGGKSGLGRLEAALPAALRGHAGPADAEQIKELVKNGADVLAYHSVGRVLNGKVVPYDPAGIRHFNPAVRAATRNPREFSEDILRSIKKGNGTIIALIGSGRELFNLLPDRRTDPDCAAGILMRFIKERPGYADKLKVIFFHPYCQNSLFGQPGREAEKFTRIAELGWKNAFVGIDLGKADLAKPLLTEDGWQDKNFWPEGPGIVSFTAAHVLLDKKLTAARLRRVDKNMAMSDFYWLPWGTLPRDGKALAELARDYKLFFAGYSGEKPVSGSPALIPARVMGEK